MSVPLPTVDLFTSELDSVGPKWYDLGIFLGISTHELDVIGKYHGSEGTQRCLIELFKYFQSRTKPVSWNDIIDALTKIHNNYLADRIHDKYIQTVSSSYPSSPPRSGKQETGSDSQEMEIVSHSQILPAMSHSHPLLPRETEIETNKVSEIYDDKRIYIDENINREFTEIITSFASLVLEIRRVLLKKSISIHEIQVVLQEIYELEPLSTEVATLERVFTRMRQHYCFLNYYILAYIVDKFLSNEKPLVQLLENYTNKLEKFKKSTKIKHLMNLIKETRDLCGKHKIIELKTRDFWGNVTLKKFDRLANLIFENQYDCAAQIRIKDGCICVSWVIPDIDTSVLVTVSPDLLKVVGVMSLKIDDKLLYEGPNEGCHILESAFLQAVELGNVRAVELLLAVSTHPSEVANMVNSNGLTPLMIGSENGHNEIVEILLKAKVDPNASLKDGLTAIYLASENGHSVVVSTLLASGADPNLARSNGWSPLLVGCQEGYNEVVEILLKAKANPNSCFKNGATAIYVASQSGHSVVISTLLTSGADPNIAESNGWTPLLVCSHGGHNVVVELLLKAKVDPNACNNNGSTAIYIASENGHSVVVSTLLASGADPNLARSNGWTPLLVGCQEGYNEVVEMLLKAKVNPNACNNNCSTAIYIASENGHSVVVSTLLAYGADPNLARSNGWSPLLVGSQEGHNEVVEILLKAKVDANSCFKNGATAIYVASQSGQSVVISTLLASGADPNIAECNGWTPLLVCSHGGHNVVVELLLKAKVNPNACNNNGSTAIYIASENGHSVVVSTLLAYGADPNLSRSNGWSPLMIGCQEGHNVVVELLLKAKVDPNACNKYGATAIYIASQNGRSVVVSTLLTSGADPNVGLRINDWTPLMVASGKGHTEVMKQLLKHTDININYQAVGGITALHLASQNGHIDIVRILLESGADSRLVDSEGRSPLVHASRFGHRDIVKLFNEFRPLGEGLRSVSLESFDSAIEIGSDTTEQSDATELSDCSDIEDCLMSLDSYPVTRKPVNRVDKIESDEQ